MIPFFTIAFTIVFALWKKPHKHIVELADTDQPEVTTDQPSQVTVNQCDNSDERHKTRVNLTISCTLSLIFSWYVFIMSCIAVNREVELPNEYGLTKIHMNSDFFMV